MVGGWLVEKTLPHVVERECSEIRKAISARELITFETTLITGRPPARFEDAIKTATASTSEAKESAYHATIDINRADVANPPFGRQGNLAGHEIKKRSPISNLRQCSSRELVPRAS